MTLYLAHWATPDDYDCARDDFPYDSPADMAEPCGLVLASRAPAVLARLRQHVVDEVCEVFGRDEEEMAPYLRAKWELANSTPGNTFYQRWQLVDPEAKREVWRGQTLPTEPLIQLIIREAQVLK